MWDLLYEWTSCETCFMNERHVGLIYEWTSCGTCFMNGRHVGLVL